MQSRFTDPRLIRRARLLAMTLVIAACTGCASIVSGTNQPVSVVTTAQTGADVAGARCAVSNDKGSWFVTTPGSVTVHRSYNDLTLNCTATGFDAGVATVKSSTKGMAAGNILFGGVIGVGVDMASGAAYDYPNLITVSMGQASGAAAAPAKPAEMTGVQAPPPMPSSVSTNGVANGSSIGVGTRLTFLDADPATGVEQGESTFTVSSVQAGQLSFNDGAIVIGADGTPVRGFLHGTTIYGLTPQQIARGGAWEAKFRTPAVATDIPVTLTLLGRQTKVISGRTLQVAKIGVEGYSTHELMGGAATGAAGAPIKGEMLVDVGTGLILEMKVSCRHPSYAVQREVVRIAGI